MDYPKITREAAYRLHIPELSGGLNRVDPLDTVKDNQLTDCKNVWFKDGVLQSRPAVHWTAEDGSPDESGGSSHRERIPPDGSALVYYHAINDILYMVYKSVDETLGEPMDRLWVYAIDSKGAVTFRQSFFPCKKDTFKNIILFASQEEDEFPYALVYGDGVTSVWKQGQYDITGKPYFWRHVTEDLGGIYAPLVLINGKGNKYDTLPSSGTSEYPRSATFEGFNTLFGNFRAGFFADGVSHEFELPSSLTTNSKVEITYSNRNAAICTWEIPAGAAVSGTSSVGQEDFQAHINRQTGLLWFTSGSDGQTAGILPMVQGVSNSILVTAVAETPACTLGNSTKAIWFGGSANGINGGSRLFLAGDSKNPGKVCWSDQGRPLYFPENCYAYVGESGQPVTAMAKQDDMLIFFKKDETYYTTYVDGPDYTADDILSGAVVDVTAVDAVFPIYQISPNIGCDQPDTIQNCDNRLIWASSPGHVYTLVSSSIYSNANIYRLTDETGPLIDTRSKALAGTLDGWYYLFQGRIAYVMDYRTTAVRSITSYAKDRSPVGWYIWQLPGSGPTVVGALSSETDGMLLISPQTGNDVGYITIGLFEEGTEDIEDYRGGSEGGPSKQVITSKFRTKLFDFGYPERMKKISSLVLKAGGKGYMDVAFATERGQTPDIRRGNFYADTTPRDPGYLHSVRFNPVAPRVRQFGLAVSASGRFALGGISLYYKTMR